MCKVKLVLRIMHGLHMLYSRTCTVYKAATCLKQQASLMSLQIACTKYSTAGYSYLCNAAMHHSCKNSQPLTQTPNANSTKHSTKTLQLTSVIQTPLYKGQLLLGNIHRWLS